jgi:hypothetical protein
MCNSGSIEELSMENVPRFWENKIFSLKYNSVYTNIEHINGKVFFFSSFCIYGS